jgi:hypothetical protein
MRRGLMKLVVPLVVAAALIAPAAAPAAAASGYSYKTVYNYCSGLQVRLKMKNIAAGYTPANKLTIESWAQRRVSGKWQTVYTWNKAVYKYAWNGKSHTLTAWRSYNANNSYWFRIVFRLRAWHNRTLLASSTFKSVKC